MGIGSELAKSGRRAFVRNSLKPKHKFVKQKMPDFRTFFLTCCRRRKFPNVQYPEFMQPMIDMLLLGKNQRGLVSTPPGHLKSTVILLCYLYIALTEEGTKQYYASYGDDIVSTQAGEFELYYEAWTGHVLGGKIGSKRIGSNVVYFSSVRGAITGKRANRNCTVDDPFKNMNEANSLDIRDTTWTNVTSALMSRMQPGCNYLCNGTRWHSDDLHGRHALDTKTEWVKINFPAILPDQSPLFPELYSMEWLHNTARTLGGERSPVWRALYMGEPLNEQLGFFPIANLHYHKNIPAGYNIIETVTGIDLAYTKASYSDLCACMHVSKAVCVGKEDIIIVREGWMEAVGTDDFLKRVKSEMAIYGSTEVHWRGAAAETDRCPSIAKEHGLVLRGHASEGKKMSAMGMIAEWKSDRVYVPDAWDTHPGSPLHQLISFTADDSRHDDGADALFVASDRLTGKLPRAVKPSPVCVSSRKSGERSVWG